MGSADMSEHKVAALPCLGPASGHTDHLPSAMSHIGTVLHGLKPLTKLNEVWTEDIGRRATSGPKGVPELPAQQMIKLAGLLDGPNQALMIMDNAAGGSVLVTELLFNMLPEKMVANVQVLAADVSRSAVCAATRKVENMPNANQILTIQMDMEKMEGMCDKDFSHVLTNFGISLAKDTEATLREIQRVLKPGGTCGFTTWSYLSWISILRSAISTIPGAPRLPHEDDVLLHLSNKKPWHEESFVEASLSEAGFENIQIQEFTAFHAFTKLQFIKTFGGAVVRYLTRRIFGKETAERYLHKIPGALSKYLDEHHSKGVQLEMRSLIVVANKKSGETGEGCAPRRKASPSAEVEEVKRPLPEADVPHY